MLKCLVVSQLCVAILGEACQCAAEQAGCSQCDVDATLLLQYPEVRSESHEGTKSNEDQPGNRTAGAVGASHAQASANVTTKKLAQQMAKQMVWEFKNSHGQLSKLAGPGTMTQLNKTSPVNLSGEEMSFFVRAVYRALPSPAVEETDVQVQLEMAAPDQILWVYLLLWMPLAFAWMWPGLVFGSHLHHGSEVRRLLQLSVGALTISAVISNQSLCILTRAPMALTLFQSAVSVVMGAMLWVYQLWCKPAEHPTARQIYEGLWRWMPCATCFACFQVADHFVSNYASISERVILGNLVPVLAWFAEMTFPETFQARDQASLSAKTALLSTVCGALFFVTQDSALTASSISACGLCSVILLIYRLVQRGVLVNLLVCPVACLLTFDSLISCGIACVLCGPADVTALRDWRLWVETPQVLVLLVLSGVGTGLGHLVVILCIRTCSATLTMVICNVASMICLVQGMVLFNDTKFQGPLAFIGMSINLIGGIWYTLSQVGVDEEAWDKVSHTSEVGADGKMSK